MRDPFLSVSESSFLRDDALLTIIWVSDEEDASIGPVAEFINAFRDLKGSERRDAFNASALVGLDNQTEEPGDCNLSDSNPNFGAHASWRYTDVVRQTGGVVGSICEDDFSDVVSQMGLTSSRLVDRFAVSRRPKANSIEMTMHVPGTPEFEGDGVVVPAEGLDGQWPWEYQEDVPAEDYAIQFTDPTSLPPLNTRIILRYDYY